MSILKAQLIYCGYCTNNEKRMFSHHGSKERVFPAAALLLRHKTLGYILCDTGYSPRIYSVGGIVPFLYEKLNPTSVTAEDTAAHRLQEMGIASHDVGTVILTHLHPDHVGGLKDFGHSRIILSSDAYKEYLRPKLKSLVFKQFFPNDFGERVNAVSFSDSHTLFGLPCKDLLDDGSVIAVRLDGHAKGQIGLFLPEHNILFCADACWKNEYADKADIMRVFPRFLQNDYKKYRKTLSAVKNIENQGIRVIYSHDDMADNGELL